MRKNLKRFMCLLMAVLLTFAMLNTNTLADDVMTAYEELQPEAELEISDSESDDQVITDDILSDNETQEGDAGVTYLDSEENDNDIDENVVEDTIIEDSDIGENAEEDETIEDSGIDAVEEIIDQNENNAGVIDIADDVPDEDKAGTVIEQGSSNQVNWTLYDNGHLIIEGTGDWERDSYDDFYQYSPWYSYSLQDRVKYVTVKLKDTKDTSYMFSGFENLERIDFNDFDTSKVTDMSCMFLECPSIKSLDLSNFKTNKVTDMHMMFWACDSLTELKFGDGFDTSKVTNMSFMFAACHSLTELKFNNKFKTSNVTNAGCMFANDTSLTSLDLSNFNLSKLKKSNWDDDGGANMLVDCGALTTIYTPINLKQRISLEAVFSDPNGNDVMVLPQNTGKSICITRDPSRPRVGSVTVYEEYIPESLDVGENFALIDYYYVWPEDAIYTVSYSSSNPKVATVNSSGIITAVSAGTSTIMITANAINGKKTAECTVTVVKPEGFEDWGDIIDEDCPDDYNSIPKGSWIGEINNCTYTGSAVIPEYRVYYFNRKLSEGIDYTAIYKNNIKAGNSATVTLKGIGKYTGSVTKKFTIDKMPISEDVISLAVSDFPENTSWTPTVIVKKSGNILKSGTDYTVTYEDEGGNRLAKQPKTAGSYYLVINGKGNCSGSARLPYTITGGAILINNAKVTVGNMTYGGALPNVSVSLNGSTLLSGVDYKAVFGNTSAKGTGNVTVMGIGNYSGSIKKNFKVQPVPMSNASVEGLVSTQPYVKGGVKPSPVVKYYGKCLIEGVDYTCSYSGNNKLSTSGSAALLTLQGKGNFSGKLAIPFNVTARNLNNSEVMAFVYAQPGKKPSVLLVDAYNGTKLAANTDYVVSKIDMDNHIVTVTGGKNGLYVGELSIGFEEYSKNRIISSAKLNRSAATQYYFKDDKFNQEINLDKKDIIVKAGSTTLSFDDYEVRYFNNDRVGKAIIIVYPAEGSGYAGAAITSFNIKQASFK